MAMRPRVCRTAAWGRSVSPALSHRGPGSHFTREGLPSSRVKRALVIASATIAALRIICPPPEEPLMVIGSIIALHMAMNASD